MRAGDSYGTPVSPVALGFASALIHPLPAIAAAGWHAGLVGAIFLLVNLEHHRRVRARFDKAPPVRPHEKMGIRARPAPDLAFESFSFVMRHI